MLVPQLVDQPIRRDDLVRPQEQDRQQLPLPAGPQLDRAIVVADLEWAEDPELHATQLSLTGPLPAITGPLPLHGRLQRSSAHHRAKGAEMTRTATISRRDLLRKG